AEGAGAEAGADGRPAGRGPSPGIPRNRCLQTDVRGWSINTDLQSRVHYLEGCECVRRRKCTWEGREVEEGHRWQTLSNTACTCTSGQVTCEAIVVGEHRPNSILPLLRHTHTHTHTHAHAGEVSCERMDASCPSLPCSHPAKPRGQCCPSCDRDVCVCVRVCVCVCVACVLEDQEYEEGARWRPEGPCSSCACVNGETVCTHTQCPPTECLHPAKNTGSCCAVCESCTYNHRIYGNGQRFVTPDQPCLVCTCQVSLQFVVILTQLAPERGEYSRCKVLQQRVCDCLFENRVFVEGEAFPSPVNVCERCVCADGRVACRSNQCPRPNCNAPVPGTCCQNNCNGCRYAGKEYPNGQEFPHPTDKCRACTCINGNVQCLMKRCPPLQCTDPNLLPGECCPQCPAPPADCVYEQRSYRHTERFYHPTDTCRSCLCTNGMVQCKRKPCPSAPCSHPITQDCCPTCEGCLYERRERADGERWADASDACSVCTCRGGSARCEKDRCPPAACSYPVQRSCCTACDGCLFKGQEYPDGYEFVEEKDPCSVCSCYSGEVSCQRRPCPLQCSHPVPSESCCPACDSCLYQGGVHAHRHTFGSSSDPCQRCTCVQGTVTCVRAPCPPAPCPRPVTPPGQCCPRLCMLDGREYQNGQQWTPQSDPCSRCTCQEGEVRCVSQECPKLPCMHQVQDPGTCCPRCRGCMYDGREHAEASSWFADSASCMNCMCVGGVTTCSQIRCISPCVNTIRVAGECCPLCADCLFEGRVYSPSDSFHPADDPCQICTCEVMPDGEQHLRCYRKQCPSLVDCPVNNILFSGPESCCPVCAQPLSNCTATLIGNEVLATDDPCFTCQCKDLTWTCLHRNCPPLTCPVGEQLSLPDSCCPVCEASGVSCTYQGALYQPGEQWAVDECTGCTCVAGDVHCGTERCPPLACSAMPAAAPGVCCPHCLPRPATCIAFGDPHYRTFDGRMLHFQGACTYVLAQDCQGGHFRIHATNDDRGRKGVSWTKEVTVFIGDLSVQLLQDWVVKVNGRVVALPYLREPYVYVERQTNTILLNTNIGIKVLWSGRSHLEVSVPGSYRKQTCGLCGDFNDFPQDDLRMPDGRISLSEASFGNSWQVTNHSHALTSCRPGEDVDPCREAGYQARKGANGRCKVLKSAVFKPCHRVVPPEAWHGACVYDLCACGANTDECLCDALEAYAGQCREAGVVLDWRSPALCAVGCPVERGFVFDECGPPCPVTCLNADVPLGVIESHCFKPCVPGCQCPAGLVLHSSHCVPPDKCPKIIHGNAARPPGAL
uniref:Kielin cysteine rich BMP regulator n=1 Tax=Gadus morhua TaxID=8049 RepID=A0A8C5BPR6_GADMO